MPAANTIQSGDFRIDIAESDLTDLRSRLECTRWPEEPAEVGWDRGVPLAYLRELAEYWATGYDWWEHEASLNEVPQARTVIDGQAVHLLHARSPERSARPLVLLHGWPGSVVEFLPVIERLRDPRGHDGDPADAFHVVVPSLPGFGFSVPLQGTGWSSGRIARTVAVLMEELGYERYAAHGSDVGAGVAGGLSGIAPDRVMGVHLASDPRTAVTFATFSGDPAGNPALSAEERATVARVAEESEDDLGYLRMQSTRPQTIAYGLTDSPVAQLAWIIEKVHAWTDPSKDLPEHAVDLDLLLTNVSLYWLTRSGASAAHVLYDGMHAEDWGQPGPAPTGWAVFGRESFTRKLLDPDGHIEHWVEYDRGGHFPAMEVPELLVADIRRFFRCLR